MATSISILDLWMDAINCSDEGSLSIDMLTFHVISRKDGLCHVDPAEIDIWHRIYVDQ